MADNSELRTQNSELPEGAEVEMPMLAGTAAARLTQQILARLSSPFAVPSASPVRPGALWRQVARRLGVAPDDRSRPRMGRSLAPLAQEQGRQAQDPFAPEPPQLVWRAVGSNKQAQQEDISPGERLAAATRPAMRYITSPLPAPAQAQAQPTPVQATPQAAVSIAPPAQPPTPIISAPPAPIESRRVQGTPNLPDVAMPTQGVASVQPVQPTLTPPAKSITVEYVPGPAAIPLLPLVSHMPLIEAAPPPPRNLADTLNRDLVPLTDIISRMTRPSFEDLPLPGERPPAPAASEAPVSSIVEQVQTPQPQPILMDRLAPPISVVQAQATPFDEAPRLEMPLAATPTTPATRQPSQPAPTLTISETLERAQRSPIRQIIDRVATAVPLPDAVRRFITGEPAPGERQPAPTPNEKASIDEGQRAQDEGRQVAANATAQVSTAPPATLIGQAPQAAQPATTVAQPDNSVSVASVSPAPTPQPPAVAPTATATSAQPSTPVQTRQAQRASTDIVPAPPSDAAPATLEMPVRVTSVGRQAEAGARQFTPVSQPEVPSRTTQPPQAPASALGPFQAFQPTPQVVQEALSAQPSSQAQPEPQPAPVQQNPQPESLGPFQPFQPAIAAPPRPADEPTSAPASIQATQPVAQPPFQPIPNPTTEAASATPTLPVQTTSDTTQVTRTEQVVSTSPVETTENTSASPIAPGVTPQVRKAEPRGFLGSMFDRLLGRGERDVVAEVERAEPRTTAIEMPWVRQGGSTQAQQGQSEQRMAPQPEMPAMRQADALAQPQGSAPAPVTQPAATPAASMSQPIAEAAATSATSTSVVDTQPPHSASAPAVAGPMMAPAEPSVTATPATTSPYAPIATPESITPTQSQPTPAYAFQETTSPVEQAPISVELSDGLDLPRVLAMPSISDAPTPLDMPHATQQSSRADSYSEYSNDAPTDALQRALAPVETVVTSHLAPTVSEAIGPPIQPSHIALEAIEQPAQSAPTAVAQASGPVEVQLPQPQPQSQPQPEPEAPQAWTLMPDMAEGLVRSHAPLSATEPMEIAAQSDLLARILGSLGQELAGPTLMPSAASSQELQRAVPAPVAGVGGAGMDLPYAYSSATTQGRDAVDGFAATAANPSFQSLDESPSAARVYTSVATASPIPVTAPVPVAVPASLPIGVPTASLVSRSQFMPDSLRDIRTTSNQPVASESFARAVTPESPSASPTPEPVSMPPRYITNVTPATYLAEAAMQSGAPGSSGSPVGVTSNMGMIMRPASYMSPSMPDYGWPGEDESGARATVMFPLSEMSPTADNFSQIEAGSGGQPQSQESQEEGGDWMATLQTLYGQKGDENMPLAVPYGGFAAPSEQMSGASAWQTPAFAPTYTESSQGRPASQGISTLQMPIPSAPTIQGGDLSFSQPSSFSGNALSSWSSDSWSTEGMSEAPGFSSWSGSSYGYSDGGSDGYGGYGGYGDSETGAWADVVASAASDTAPALALAAAESPPPSSPQEPTNTQEGGQGASADLDELAESVLDIIRNKIVIERERNFG